MSMESCWSYDSENKGFVLSNETVSPADFLNSGSKTVLMSWGLKDSSYSYDDNSVLLSIQQQPLENQGILDVGFPDMTRKQSSNVSLKKGSSTNGSGVGDVINAHSIPSNGISGDEESSSRLSNSVVDSNSRESSLIDLKLGRFGDNLNYNANNRRPPILSSAESSTPSKRVKASSLNSQPAFCQVYGCNKDLSSSKDYHKRHKVCDVHSKTAKVIVNGLEQRFCQQCSRFHLLGEFDDGKRSCRRRLAGHNERRRKPQVGLNSGRAGRLLHSYNGWGGARPNDTTVATTFICQDILPSSSTAPPSDKCEHIKFEDGGDFTSKLASSWINGHLLQRPLFSPCGLAGKQFPLSESVNTAPMTMTASVFNENNLNQYHHPQPQDSGSCSLFQSNLFNTASTVQGLPELSESGCALSLLSSQSHNTPGHHHHHHHHHQSSGISSTGHPLLIPGSGSHHSFSIVDEVSENLFGPSSLDLNNGHSSKYPSYVVTNPVGRNQMNPVAVALSNGNATTVVGSDFTAGGFLHGSEYVNMKDGPSFDDGATIDLLQLSTQLQRVEHQRQAVPVKQEDDTFCSLKIT